MKKPDPSLVELLYKALNSTHGILATTNDVERLRQKLYEARKIDEELSVLILSPYPTDPKRKLAIIKPPEKPNAGEPS